MNIYSAIQCRKRGGMIKHSHFYDLYSNHFMSYQSEKIKILEIGVYNGGSLYMWRKFFDKAELIVGIDIDPYCKRWEDKIENIFIEIGDQSDSEFLKTVNEKYGPFDIIIDDGGHENNQTITSLKTLFPLLNNEGTYVIEDTYHSYWPNYSCDRDKSTETIDSNGNVKGGKPISINKIKSSITTMEFLKSLTDKLNVPAYIEDSIESKAAEYKMEHRSPDEFEKSLFSISFYDNVCFIHKTMRNGIDSFGVSEWIGHNNEIPEDPNYE